MTDRSCSVEGCKRPYGWNGMCAMHANRIARYGDPGPLGTIYDAIAVCTVEGCGRKHNSKGLCSMHRKRMLKTGTTDAPESRNRPSFCTIDGCDREHFGKGLCQMHWRRQHKFGVVGPVGQIKATKGTPVEWLRSLPKTGECIEWPYCRQPNGYGKVQWGDRIRLAHHVSMILHGLGDRPDGLVACHACDNPSCVNPSHLRWDTPAENMADRGRLPFCR